MWFLAPKNWILAAFIGLFFGFWTSALPRGFLNINLRVAYVILFLGSAYHAGRWLFLGIGIACIAGEEVWRVWPLRDPSPIELKFPLAGAAYYVAQGGKTIFLNHHFRNISQKYALDILKLNKWGGVNAARRADAGYAAMIFDEPIFSPCDGTVTVAVDGFPDLPVGERDTEHVAGNFIVIRCNGLYVDGVSIDGAEIYVGLAHLKSGSVCVKPGDVVRADQMIGRVGNSGNTTLPHLHIHAKRGGNPANMLDGQGVPMKFGGRWLARNSVVRVRGANASSS